MDITGLGTIVLAVVISCMLIYSTWSTMYRKCNFPPGPTPLPVIGNLLQIKRGRMVKSLMDLSEKYGSVYTLYFGSRPVIILCGYQAVKEALIDQGDEFSGRGRLPTLDRIIQGYGVILSSGERWKQLRRFTLMTLRNFGMGKRSIEERIQEEAQCLVEELKTYKQSPVNPTNIFVQTVSNVICSVVFGNRYEYDDVKFLKLLNMFNETFILMSSTWGQLQDMMPSIINHVPGPHQKIDKLLANLLEFISETVKVNQDTLDPSSPRDYIDCFLIKMQQDKQNATSEFTIKNLLMSVLTVFFAGTETVSSTLRHGFLILLKYPEIQAKLHGEIDCVIGQNRAPNIEDRGKMPYTDAVIHEIQRFSDVIPLNVPHSVVKDTNFRGYTIPKGTDVYPLLCSVLWDPSQFPTPNKFNPGHFLDDNGCFKKSDAFLPFSTAKAPPNLLDFMQTQMDRGSFKVSDICSEIVEAMRLAATVLPSKEWVNLWSGFHSLEDSKKTWKDLRASQEPRKQTKVAPHKLPRVMEGEITPVAQLKESEFQGKTPPQQRSVEDQLHGRETGIELWGSEPKQGLSPLPLPSRLTPADTVTWETFLRSQQEQGLSPFVVMPSITPSDSTTWKKGLGSERKLEQRLGQLPVPSRVALPGTANWEKFQIAIPYLFYVKQLNATYRNELADCLYCLKTLRRLKHKDPKYKKEEEVGVRRRLPSIMSRGFQVGNAVVGQRVLNKVLFEDLGESSIGLHHVVPLYWQNNVQPLRQSGTTKYGALRLRWVTGRQPVRMCFSPI
ncbi:cytochrome P450 2G1-like isoform X2 [Ascaphus truei]|uniref:cytochrome P450 2G1-like isoform X2 n=1 Tax=Ascaphus truei TaxID=8439 RepID=UPI003F5ADB27